MLGDIFSKMNFDDIKGEIPVGDDNIIMKLAKEMSNDIQSGNSALKPDELMKSMMSETVNQ